MIESVACCRVNQVERVPHHISREPAPSARGAALGAAQAPAVANTVRFYERLLGRDLGLERAELRRAGRTVGELLAARRPGFLAEIEGIAAGARVDAEILLAVNARTELLANASYASGAGTPARGLLGECTVVGVLPEASATGRCLLAQNWDFHPDLRASRLVWTVVRDGRWLTTLTEAGILAKIGLNSDGLGVAINFLACDADTGLGALPVHLLIRQLLEDGADLSTALGLVRAASPRISICLTLGLAQQDEAALVSVEVAPDAQRYVWPAPHGVLVHANHFLDARSDDRYLGPHGAHGTLVRQWYAEHALSDPPISERALGAVFSSRFNAPQAIRRSHRPSDPWLERSETLASVVMDLTGRRLAVAAGAPGEGGYRRYAIPCDTSA